MSASQPCKTPCSNCSRTGLPVLFGRYGVAYHSQTSAMDLLRRYTPKGQLQARPGGIKLDTAVYNLRMLRAGYLYLCIDRAGGKEWEGYAVHPQGFLNKFDVMLPATARVKIACARGPRQANNSLVWIDKPSEVTRVWYMFHPDLLDPRHLKREVEPKLDTYMQSFDAKGWFSGNHAQKDTAEPEKLYADMLDYGAFSNKLEVRDACEPLLYGLMGSNAKERGWGDYLEDVEMPVYSIDSVNTGATETVAMTVKQPTYGLAHATRLLATREMLMSGKGAVVACEDPLGITQELGHLQAEAQVAYTAWQARSANGLHESINNEWVCQTAVAAQSLRKLIKDGTVARTEADIKQRMEVIRRMPPMIYPDEATRRQQQEMMLRRREEQLARDRARAAAAGEEEFAKYYDEAKGKEILEEQRRQVDLDAQRRSKLGQDQVAWLNSQALLTAANCYSGTDDRIGSPGGGASLSKQLAQALAGTESNRAGHAWIKNAQLVDGKPLSLVLTRGNAKLKAAMQAIMDESGATLPAVDPTTPLADKVANLLKPFGARVALGDKALAFLDEFPSISQSDRLQKLAWPAHVASLMSVKMVQTVQGMPVARAEAALTRLLSLTAVATVGSTADRYAVQLARADQDRLRNATNAATVRVRRGLSANAAKAVPNVRASALAGVLDVAQGIIKGVQFGAKLDARSGTDMVGGILQGIGSVMDWRAKAYEETIYKSVKAHDLFTAPGMRSTFEGLQLRHLKSLRVTAFKFLAPAAVISMVLDSMDAIKSAQRQEYGLMLAQIVSAVGTLFTIAGSGASIVALMTGGAAAGISAGWAAAAAVFGLIGAVIAVVAIIAIWALSDEPWVNWLQDNPLNKLRNRDRKAPIHDNLKDTLQQLANAQAELQGG
uniref:T6SS effector BTH_I2691 family protein n=1 Tax=Cupriavidus sp. WGlv3 TaxID=2919924 RepID=UPI00273A60D4|nr:T6SS effector BTH_I2691 family protein [Cupriavidus sp. WGlv3]